MTTAQCCKRGLVLGLLLLVIGASATSAAAEDPPLDVEVQLKKTVTSEGRIVLLKLRVTNTGAETVTGVSITDVEVTGTGWATLWKWPSPAVKDIAPGKTRTYNVRVKTFLPGTIEVQARVATDDGDTPLVQSPSITVLPKKIGPTAVTDAFGEAWLKAGKAKIPVTLVDRDTGSPLGGVTLAAKPMKGDPSRVLVAAVDPWSRYPLQFLVLEGASGAGGADSVPPPLPPSLELPLWADSEGAVSLALVKKVLTTLLPPPEVGDLTSGDLSKTLLKVLKLLAKGQHALPAPFSGQAPKVLFKCLTLDEVDIKMAEIVGTCLNPATLENVATNVLWKGAEAVGGPVVELANSILSAKKNVSCILDAKDAVVWDCLHPQSLKLCAFQWGPVPFIVCEPQSEPLEGAPAGCGPFKLVHVDASGQGGLDLVNGCVELASISLLGLTATASLDDEGQAELALPDGIYTYTLCGEGHAPEHGLLVVEGDDTTLEAELAPKPLCADGGQVSTGQTTGFLPAGTSFPLTATFLECDGGLVACDPEDVVWDVVGSPFGPPVATVSDDGVVTMTDACGAAWVTAWCNGVQALIPKLISTDCKGKLPPEPPPIKPPKGSSGLTGTWAGTYDYVRSIWGGVTCGFIEVAAQGTITIDIAVGDIGYEGEAQWTGVKMLGWPSCTAVPVALESGTVWINDNQPGVGAIVGGFEIEDACPSGCYISTDFNILFGGTVNAPGSQMIGAWSGSTEGGFVLVRQ